MQIHWNRAVRPRRVKGFKILTSFYTQESFEKIYYKCIPLCSFKLRKVLNF